MTEAEHNKDLAELRNYHIKNTGCYVSFYTGYDGQGGVLRETFYRSFWDHNDNRLHAMATRRAKDLGACSWVVFKPVGVAHNVDYGRDEDSRLEYLENKS